MLDIEYKQLSYICPECRRRYKIDVPYSLSNPKAKLEKGRWCYCEAIHNLKYTIQKKRTGEVIIKVTEFVCNGEVKPKHFSQLD